jgi:Flp pilus assembly protein TadG
MLKTFCFKAMARRVRKKTKELGKCQSGLALIEFAYCLPVFTGIGLTGVEIANLAITNMKVSQIAMSVADNISRAKQSVPLGLPQLREHDINDAFIGANLQGDDLTVFRNGRMIVSSLQQNASGGQWIAWQRCKGTLPVTSSYGVENTGQTGNSFPGMGSASRRVVAEPGTAIIFVEFTYTYKSLVASTILGPITLREETAFFVRDDRDLSQVYNPSPSVTRSACNVFTAT